MHQIAQFQVQKCKSSLPWEGGTHPPPLGRFATSGLVASLPRNTLYSVFWFSNVGRYASLVCMGYSPIITQEQTGSVRGSRRMHKMAATTCSVVSHPAPVPTGKLLRGKVRRKFLTDEVLLQLTAVYLKLFVCRFLSPVRPGHYSRPRQNEATPPRHTYTNGTARLDTPSPKASRIASTVQEHPSPRPSHVGVGCRDRPGSVTLNMFFNKVLQLAFHRLHTMCNLLNLNKELVRNNFISIFHNKALFHWARFWFQSAEVNYPETWSTQQR